MAVEGYIVTVAYLSIPQSRLSRDSPLKARGPLVYTTFSFDTIHKKELKYGFGSI